MYWFLSQNWSGLVIAILAAIVSGAVFLLGRSTDAGILHTLFSVLGVLLLVGSTVLLLGSLFHLLNVVRHRRRYPPPGKLVDIGGYNLHILAEGDGETPVVWIPGSHDQGLAFHHLHSELAKETRSILYDRAGSGWSDIGPFPRSVWREADELRSLLQEAGETGPFIVVAHSLGGFVAQSFAARFRTQVAGLVLLDSSSADGSTYTSRMKENRIPGFGWKQWALSAFGLAWIIVARMQREQPDWLRVYEEPIREPVILGNCQPKLSVGFAAALSAVFANPFDLVRGEGVLGDMPLFAVIPPISENLQIQQTGEKLPHFTECQVKNLVHLLMDSQAQIAKLSSRGELHFSPEGTTHSFPFEAPEATLNEVREMLDLVSRGREHD